MKGQRGFLNLLLVGAMLVSLLAFPLAAPATAAGEGSGVHVIADFEAGLPDGWFVYNGGASSVTPLTEVVGDGDPLARPGQMGDNTVLTTAFTIGDYGGMGQDFAGAGGSQHWGDYAGLSFWFYGSNSGLTYQVDIMDNRSDPSFDTAERFAFFFDDDFVGWQQIRAPWSAFVRRIDWQPDGAPDDGLTLTEMWGWAFVLPSGSSTFLLDDVGLFLTIIDDFESGLPAGSDGDGNAIGFFTFQDTGGSTVAISTTDAPPAPVPSAFGLNNVLQVDTHVVTNGWAGLVHAFENEALDTWTPQDWSGYEGFSLWLYGNNTGKTLFLDILDNRAPGSTGDTAERFSIDIVDDFGGWQLFQIPFASFSRKEIGNGAPNDGFTLTEVHGWAFGVFSSEEPFTNYLDDVGLYGEAEIPELAVGFTTNVYDVVEGDTAVVAVKLNRPVGQEDDPEQVTVSYTTADGSATGDRDYTPASGTFTFVPDGPSEQTFTVPTVDNAKYEGGKTIILYLSDAAGALLGPVFKARIDIEDDEEYDPNLIDDFEKGTYLWRSSDNLTLSNPEIAAGDPLALPGQGAYERILEAATPVLVDIVVGGSLCNKGNGVVPVAILTTGSFDALTIDHNTVLFGDAAETHRDKKTGEAKRHEEDFDGDGDLDLVFHFRLKETGYDCDSTQLTLTGETFDGQLIIAGGEGGFFRDFAIGQDWTRGEGLSFWFYGTDSGDPITVQLKDNRKPGQGHWSLVWSDEFDDPAGTPPNPANWTPEIGDGTANANPGWGNQELQYYTGSTENVASDGQGNLVITAKEAVGSQICYYGPCEYTSARLISWHKAEFAYGRIEARIRVPQGAGLWPAFWTLGTDIGEVGWPQSGEIDIMEFVGREPNEIFGTIHGPGYSGGASFGDTYTFGVPVYEQFHEFAIEWQPDRIKWYVDDILYHTATPADVAPNEWVFNHPFFIIMNVAVGGNFGGPVGEDTVFPQEMLVDYVRVYQGPDTAERFEASFTDNFSGWQQITIPFTSFTRSDDQPPGAKDDGLGLDEVWGYGFELPEGGTTSGTLRLDQVRLELLPPPTEIVVTNLDDSGTGSLRQALADIAIGGTITFDPGLAGGTISLTTGPLVPGNNVTIDASAAPGLTVSGGGIDRVLIVEAGVTVDISHLIVADGYGWQLAGGILNNGALSLDHVTVTGNTMATDAGDFWQGGGGIYNGEGATLELVDSSVVDNTAGWSGGGVYSFFNTNSTIVRSTISGNLSNDVGGGIRMLGNATIVNSTISGNTSTGWYGGAIFHTDGVMEILNSTIANNIGPDWAPSAIFLGSYSSFVPELTLTNTIITGNQWYACEQYASGGTVSLISGGHNLVQDDSCNPVASDLIGGDAGIGPLADNGGPTLTHALLAASPAIDTADGAVCPATDQRGIARPQGAGCDVGAYEYVPE
jgi:beta-glucanase (GH16 family)